MRRAATASLLATLVWVSALEARAEAQDDDSEPLAVPAEEDPAASGEASTDGSFAASGRATAELGATGAASRGWGVSAASMMGAFDLDGDGTRDFGLFGPGVVYDAGAFHIEALLAFASADGFTEVGAAGRFWYHLHQSAGADFSVGGGIGLLSIDVDGADEASTVLDLEGGAELRLFLVENVSLSAALGLVVLGGDADGIELTGDLAGSSAITYFF